MREVAPVGGVVVKQTEAIPVARQGDSRSLGGGNSCIALITPEPGPTTRRMHAGSLEALRVTRPEAVDLERIKAITTISANW